MDSTIGSVLIALSGVVTAVLTFFLGRAAKRKDQKAEERDRLRALEEQVLQQAKIIEIIPQITDAVKVQLEERLRYIGNSYISNKEIFADELDNWKRMHAAYKAIGGNGYVDDMQIDLDKLPRKYR